MATRRNKRPAEDENDDSLKLRKRWRCVSRRRSERDMDQAFELEFVLETKHGKWHGMAGMAGMAHIPECAKEGDPKLQYFFQDTKEFALRDRI